VTPELAAAVSAAWPGDGPIVRGLAAAVAGGRGACVVVTDRALTEAELAAVAAAAGSVLGAGQVEVAALHAASADAGLEDLVRQWVNQAAQGSGRGVRVRLAPSGDGPGAPVRVLVEAIDSSARELALRLASPWEPALPALRALLATEVTVEDAETAQP
jgi:NAD(P)-dependent dehydrogenase (short-subunit alcohol dehydrogenase family)